MKKILILTALLSSAIGMAQEVPATQPIVKSITHVAQDNPPSPAVLNKRYLDTDGNYYKYNGSAWVEDNAGTGSPGPAGAGVAVGGTAGQILSKVNSTDYNTTWIDPPTGTGSGDVTAASPFGTDNSLIVSDGTGKGVKASSQFTISPSGDFIDGNRISLQLLETDEFIMANNPSPASAESNHYWDFDTDHRLMVYTDGQFKKYLLEGDVTGADSGQGFAYVEKTSATEETYNNSDITLSGSITGKKLYNNHITNDASIILGSGITLYNQTWIEATEDATLTIKKGSGATFILDGIGLNTDDGITIPEYSTVSIMALSSNKFRIWVNSYTSYAEITSLYNTANAISPDTEADAITDISVFDLGNTNTPSITSVASDANGTGDYSIQVTNLNGDAIIMIKPPSGFSAGTYDISMDISANTSATGTYFYLNGGDEWSISDSDQYLTNFDGTWETKTLSNNVYDGPVDSNSGRIRVYIPSSVSPTDVFKLDNLIILEDE